MEISYQDFMKKWKPIKNKFNKNAHYRGTMFETDGEEREFVLKQDPHKIWTLIDGEGTHLYIVSGWRAADRLGYFVTRKRWKEGENFFVED
jgi:hypothetical protein